MKRVAQNLKNTKTKYTPKQGINTDLHKLELNEYTHTHKHNMRVLHSSIHGRMHL